MLLFLSLVHAEVPLPIQPECGEPDRLDLCPADMGQDWALLSWVPSDWTEVDPAETATGISATHAWRTTTGRTDVLLAVLDSGILWDEEHVRRKHFLNVGELPLPQDADGVESTTHDLDENGVVNVVDYEQDPRVAWDLAPHGHPDLLDPADLILAFSDGVDDDDNGFVDDVSGWDFLWNDNDPYDDTEFDHGTYEAKEAAQEGGDETGGIGVCPNCMVLSIRVSDSFVADGNHFGAGVLYALEMDADIVQEALGTLTHPDWVTETISRAWDSGVLVVASAADETAYHHNSPGWVDRTLYVHAVVPNDDDNHESSTFLANSNCTNHGARLQLSASSTGCSSGATGMTSGAAGLLISAARDQGIELSPGQIVQLFQQTADDVWQEPDPKLYPSSEGWDRTFGYGRLNVAAAVDRVVAGDVPESVEITSPTWFETVSPVRQDAVQITGLSSGEWTLEMGWGDEPTDWEVVGTGSGDVDVSLDLTSLDHDAEAVPPVWTGDEDIVERETAVNLHTLTLRLSSDGSEARRAIYVHHDADWKDGFPQRLAGSLESSPVLADLDGDGVLDVIQADGSGAIHALHGDGTPVAGWPVQTGLSDEWDPEEGANHLGSAWFAEMDVRQGLIGTLAVGDVDGDGSPDVVGGTLQGELWAWSASGEVLPGFPVEPDPVTFTSRDALLDEGWFASPALGDIDGDGTLDIVAAGMDQQVYVFDGTGSKVSGFPVRLAYPGYEDLATRIVSSPALGDVDGDGDLDIAIGTNETLNGFNGAIYVVDSDGSVLPGWPQAVFGAYTQALPFVGEGVPVSPAMADMDGDGTLEIAAWTQAGEYNVFDHDGEPHMTPAKSFDVYGDAATLRDGSSFPLINNPSFGDLNGDGFPELVSGGMGSEYAVGMLFDGRRVEFSHSLNAWDGRTGEFLPAFPRVMEDLQFFANPAVADVDGDRCPEIITGTGGFLVHAIDAQGRQPTGWPKLTGQWNMASPAVGDIDGDRFLDVVTGTRGGWLYAWTTTSIAGATVEWAGFGHDPQNTSNLSTPLPDGYNGGYPDAPEKKCGCTAGALAPGWLALLVLFGLRRRD
ncbi:MAG: S8 family serine peptidase [Proteobacteria bacterium]|nr:S8 family serine peptidase [Pseudomonadota bacterium]